MKQDTILRKEAPYKTLKDNIHVWKESKRMSSIPKTAGERLVCAIKNKSIVMDYKPSTGKNFQGGYEELYLYKFKKYQSSVGRYIRNQQLNEEAYHG